MNVDIHTLDFNSPFNPKGACDQCHKRKMRCDKHKPQCHECSKRNMKCSWGLRLKRGPKKKKQVEDCKVTEISQDQLENIKKSNAQLNAMLFELEFNKKMVELWKNLFINEDGKTPKPFKRIRPQFNPATESFIRSPDAVHTVLADFDTTYRVMFSLPDYAANIDFASKIWHAIIDVNLSDLLTIFNGFETTLLLSILEYLVAFLLGLKLAHYDDISKHICSIIYHIVNQVVYARDPTTELGGSSQLLIQLIVSMVLMTGYYKMCKDTRALIANAQLSYEIYTQHSRSRVLNTDLEGRIYCRMLMNSKNPESRKFFLDKLSSIANLSPNVQFNVALHLVLCSLSEKSDLSEAERNIHLAEHYFKGYIEQIPLEKRSAIEEYYDGWIGVIYSEVAMRMGNVSLAQQRLGRLIQLFPKLKPSCQRLFLSNYEFLMFKNKCLLTKDYVALIHPGVIMYKQPRSESNSLPIKSLQNDSDELIESDDSSHSINNDSNRSPLETLDGVSDEFTADQMTIIMQLGDMADPFFSDEYAHEYIDNSVI